jgi:hypothetical protein
MQNKYKNEKSLSSEQAEELLQALKTRFENHPERHPDLNWQDIQARLDSNPEKLWSLQEMEKTGGEPDVIGVDQQTGAVIFCDCSAESPTGRRSLCYDRQAWEDRKANRPENNAIDMASAMGIDLLTEEQYRHLQSLGEFDTKTSSWLKTPPSIRQRGGAIFGDRRYGAVFIYHNGASSYYGARGFRGLLQV